MKKIDVAEKVVNEGIGGMMIDLVRRTHLLYPAFVHQNHAIGDLQCFFLIVRHENAGDLQFIVKPPEPQSQFFADFGVEGTEGLVYKQSAGLDSGGTRKSDSLPLPAGKLGRVAIAEPI